MKYQLKPAFLALVAVASGAGAVHADPATSDPNAREEQLEKHLDELTRQLQEVRAELKELKSQNASATPAEAPPQAPAVAVQPAPPPNPAPTSPFENFNLWGYGEIYYTRPTHDSKLTEFDLARAVFGIGYRFDDRTLFNSEYEVEHAVASSSDVGEFEVEQFYIDRVLSEKATVRAGLLLMPFGLLNEYHEPTNFYGVQRNFVETLIIPSTWREGGLAMHGDTDFGLHGTSASRALRISRSGTSLPNFRSTLRPSTWRTTMSHPCSRPIRSSRSPRGNIWRNTFRLITSAFRALKSAAQFSRGSWAQFLRRLTRRYPMTST